MSSTETMESQASEEVQWFSIDFPEYGALCADDAFLLADAIGVGGRPWE